MYRAGGCSSTMFKRWFKSNKQSGTTTSQQHQVDLTTGEDEQTLLMTLTGRSIRRNVKPEIGSSILKHAEMHKVDWSSNCRRGTCARCRSKVIEGMAFLSAPNDAEIARLEPEELEAGFRLGCQATVRKEGKIVIKHAPYF